MSSLLVDFPDKEGAVQQIDTNNNASSTAATNSTSATATIAGSVPKGTGGALDMSDHSQCVGVVKLSQVIPEEYLYDPFNAEPTLDNLRQAAVQLESGELDPDGDIVNVDMDDDDDDNDNDNDDDTISNLNNININKPTNNNNNSKKTPKHKKLTSLETLLTAADKDVTLHMARIKAVLAQDPTLLNTYQPQSDPLLQQRSNRLTNLQSRRDELQSKAGNILAALNDDLDTAGGANSNPGGGNSSAAKQQKDNVTRANLLQTRLTAWEKALELYIYCPPTIDPLMEEENDTTTNQINGNATNSNNNTTSSTSNTNSNNSINNNNNNNNNSSSPTSITHKTSMINNNNKPTLSLLQLLHHLTLIAKQDEPLTPTTADESTTLTQTLSHAMAMCTSHLDDVSSFLSDATEQSAEQYQSYQIHLIAHQIAANRTLERTEGIQESFLLHGREALKVGHALEMAEAKRRQSERASVLLRRWWMMENLAESEEFSGEEIKVNEEIRGVINSSSCRMDPLFTRVEHSLEASRVLRSLRLVVKCQSNSGGGASTTTSTTKSNTNSDDSSDDDNEQPKPTNTTTNTTNTGGFMLDPQAIKRFERTNNLLQRTSTALEKRLLNSFSQIYTKGGTYDFTSTNAAKRNGRLDWVMLRECAEALMNFDSGRSLHQRFVDLVVTTRFPELFLDGEGVTENEYGYVSDSDGDDNSPTKGGNNKSMRRMNTEEQQEHDMDTTRNKLSTLFHEVQGVCTEEFQLIAHVFSPNLPPHLLKDSNTIGKGGVGGSGKGGTTTGGGGGGGNNPSSTSPSSFSDTYPLHVARALLQRIISDPYKGMPPMILKMTMRMRKRTEIPMMTQK